MKSSKYVYLVATAAVVLSTAVYARGPMSGQSNAGGVSAGAQARSANPGAGVATRDQSRAHTATLSEEKIRARLQTMDADGVPVAGTGLPGAVVQRGIHTPGTGLIPAEIPAVVAQ